MFSLYNGHKWLVCPQLDSAFLSQVCGQPGEADAVHLGLQPGEFLEKAGSAGDGEALVTAKRADQADQDRRTSCSPRQETCVPTRCGVGDEGRVRRYFGANWQTPSCARVATRVDGRVRDCFRVAQAKERALIGEAWA